MISVVPQETTAAPIQWRIENPVKDGALAIFFTAIWLPQGQV